MVSSFKVKELEDFKKINPDVKLGFIVEDKKTDIVKTAQDLGVFSVNISKKLINKELIDDLHKRGFEVFVWTVNKKEILDDISYYPIDGIITDDVEMVINYYDSK